MNGSIVHVCRPIKKRAATCMLDYRQTQINFQHLQYINIPFTLVKIPDESRLTAKTDNVSVNVPVAAATPNKMSMHLFDHNIFARLMNQQIYLCERGIPTM